MGTALVAVEGTLPKVWSMAPLSLSSDVCPVCRAPSPQLAFVKNGYITAPQGPGLGTKLQPDVLKRKDARIRRSAMS